MVGEQIGHIPKTMAAKLVKYIDNGWLAVEAVGLLLYQPAIVLLIRHQGHCRKYWPIRLSNHSEFVWATYQHTS